MMMTLQNPIRDLTRQQKIVLGIAGGAIVGLATVAALVWAAKSDLPPVKKALEVGEDCTAYSITSVHQLRDELRELVRTYARQGAIDPLQLTAKYIRRIAPRCPTYPQKTETPGQAQLFAEICTELLGLMYQEKYLSASDYDAWFTMMTTWTEAQGAPAEEF